MKLDRIVIVIAAAVVAHLIPSTSLAAPRARTPAETVLLDSAARLALGSAHSCQVNDDGTVRCWGSNEFLQLGDATTSDSLIPVPVVRSGTPPAPLTGVVAIAAGNTSACALLAGGTVSCWGGLILIAGSPPAARPISGITNAVGIAAGANHRCVVLATGGARCWGDNLFGQLGDDTNNNSSIPVTVRNLTNAVAIAAGTLHTCALLADGKVLCWGRNDVGQLGDGSSFTDHATPFPVSGITNAVAIAAGSAHTCALLADGTVRCWGADFSGQRGDGTASNDPRIPAAVTGLTNAAAIAAGGNHSCALLGNGTAMCWGENNSGQLGDDSRTDKRSPEPVKNLVNAVAIGVGKGLGGVNHTCALLADGSVRCWGDNASGQIGDGTTTRKLTQSTVAGGGGSVTARDIATGNSHTCAVRANSTVACWGLNNAGQLGDGTTTNSLTPKAVPGLVNVVAIAAGAGHTCALFAAGSVSCWGANLLGQLGNNSNTDSRIPVPVTGLANAVAIAAGREHTCALLADGTGRCWGDNSFGQLGDGFNENRSVPGSNPVGNLGNVVAIAPGRDHTCARFASGGVRCWGRNNSGQLGNGFTTNSNTPVEAVALPVAAVAVAAGDSHTCALLADTRIRCWGGNSNGAIGNNSTVQQNSPAEVFNVINAMSIAPGEFYTCAVLLDTSARCWGANGAGQIGDGTTIQRLTATAPSKTHSTVIGGTTVTVALTGVVQIATGQRHTCAIFVSGAVSCWGENTSGQLGIGTTTLNQLTSVSVPSFTLNIDPLVRLRDNSRVASIQIIANCELGQRLHVDVVLAQGEASGSGVLDGECTGGVAFYPVTLPAHGRVPFRDGPAQVTAEALIGEHRSEVETQEWTRAVQIQTAP